MDQENSLKVMVIVSGALFGLITVSIIKNVFNQVKLIKFIGFGLTFIAQEVNDVSFETPMVIKRRSSWFAKNRPAKSPLDSKNVRI